MTTTVTYQLRLADLRALRDRRRSVRWAPLISGAFIVIYVILAVLSWSVLSREASRAQLDMTSVTTFAVLFGFTSLVPLLLLLGLAVRAVTLRKSFAGSIMALGPITLGADADALYAEQIGTRAIYPWSAFSSVEVTAEHIFLFLSPLQPLIVPRIAVEGSELARLLITRGAEQSGSRMKEYPVTRGLVENLRRQIDELVAPVHGSVGLAEAHDAGHSFFAVVDLPLDTTIGDVFALRERLTKLLNSAIEPRDVEPRWMVSLNAGGETFYPTYGGLKGMLDRGV